MEGPFCRLAMRVEGEWWVAYLAKTNTMEAARELGRIRMSCAEMPSIKDATLDYFKIIMGEILKGALGVDIAWPNPPMAAPEHEKAGSA